MKIAILGCGWLGFPLGKNLVAKGHQVVGSVTSEAKTIPLSEAGIQPVVLHSILKPTKQYYLIFSGRFIGNCYSAKSR
jgi:Trk K+ transport system NAD-binding subunit